jgi:hypothetical protein
MRFVLEVVDVSRRTRRRMGKAYRVHIDTCDRPGFAHVQSAAEADDLFTEQSNERDCDRMVRVVDVREVR